MSNVGNYNPPSDAALSVRSNSNVLKSALKPSIYQNNPDVERDNSMSGDDGAAGSGMDNSNIMTTKMSQLNVVETSEIRARKRKNKLHPTSASDNQLIPARHSFGAMSASVSSRGSYLEHGASRRHSTIVNTDMHNQDWSLEELTAYAKKNADDDDDEDKTINTSTSNLNRIHKR